MILKTIRSKQGFTLVEIMVAVGIVILLAALSIHGLLRSRMNANDGAVIGGMKSIAVALEAYKLSHNTYTGVLNDLVGGEPPYLSDQFSNGNHQGYNFYIAYADGNRYAAYAQPEQYGVTGSHFIIYDQSGLQTFDSYGSSETYFSEHYPDGGGGLPDPPPGYGGGGAGEGSGEGGGEGGGGGGGGGGCFLANTPILMANGLSKPIQEVKVGDKIIAFDEKTSELKKDKVIKFFQHESGEYLIINGYLRVTSNHPVYSNGKWVEIGTLKVGDKLLNSGGKPEQITSIKKVKERVLVYNLEVNPYHTYIAGGIVVHNKVGESAPPFDGGQ